MWFIYNIIVAIKVFHKGEVESFIQEIIKFVISDLKMRLKVIAVLVMVGMNITMISGLQCYYCDTASNVTCPGYYR